MWLTIFYKVKPLIPRRMQIFMRRIRARRIRARYGDVVVDHVGLGKTDIQWPNPYRAAALLTHDVETSVGQRLVGPLLQLEEQRGIRSCWNFVVHRYSVDEDLIKQLQELGHEVGVHGVYHDGKMFASEEEFSRRMKVVYSAAAAWGATGFRSPALLHDMRMLETIRLAWDSSVPAWDPFQPMPGGCGIYQPYYLNEECLELPVTLWQDFTLFRELEEQTIDIWLQQIRAIRDRGGLINVIVHPDYMEEESDRKKYVLLMEELLKYKDVWIATPKQIVEWMRTSGQGKSQIAGSE